MSMELRISVAVTWLAAWGCGFCSGTWFSRESNYYYPLLPPIILSLQTVVVLWLTVAIMRMVQGLQDSRCVGALTPEKHADAV